MALAPIAPLVHILRLSALNPLVRPDDGSDIKANMLCVCPNHHKLVDCGGTVIDDRYRLIQNAGLKAVRDLKNG